MQCFGGSLAVRCAIFKGLNCSSKIALVDASVELPGFGHLESFCVEKGRRFDGEKKKDMKGMSSLFPIIRFSPYGRAQK